MNCSYKRGYVEVNLSNLKNNYDIIKNMYPQNKTILCVVKADAYGHGAVAVSSFLENYCKVEYFGTATLDEAIELRKNKIKANILVFGYTSHKCANLIFDNNIIQTVVDLDHAQMLNKELSLINKKVRVHIKLDTGMTRLGLDCFDENVLNDIIKIMSLPFLIVEGVYTHLSSADEFSESSITFTKSQIETFKSLILKIESSGYTIKHKHFANSAGILNYSEFDESVNMIRPGTILYGLSPSEEMVNKCNLLNFKQVLCLKSQISIIKDIKVDSFVSYGKTKKAYKNSVLAVVSVGYADGYPRSAALEGYVSLNKKRANIIGKICMDQFVIDITGHENVKRGDEVLLLATDNVAPTVNSFAKIVKTIPIDISSSLGKRLFRIYKK